MKRTVQERFEAAFIAATVCLVAVMGGNLHRAFGGAATSPETSAPPLPSPMPASTSTATHLPEASETKPAADFRGMGAPVSAAWTIEPAGEDVQAFRVTVSGFSAQDTPEGYALSIPGQAASTGRGLPDLPSVAVLLRGRPGSMARVQLSPPTWTEISGIRVAPAESRVFGDVTTNGTMHRTARIPDPEVYGADRFWPPAVAQLREAWMGTGKVLRLECFPLQYNPARKVIRYASRIEGEIVFKAAEQPLR